MTMNGPRGPGFAFPRLFGEVNGWHMAMLAVLTACVLAYPFFSIVIPKVGSGMHAVLFLIGCGFVLAGKHNRLHGGVMLFLCACILYFVVSAISYLAGIGFELGQSILSREIRLVALWPVALVVFSLSVNIRLADRVFLYSAFVVVGLIGLELIISGIDELDGATIEILFGHLLATSALLLLGLRDRFYCRERAVWSVAFVLLLLACLLSGTRGGWLSLIVGSILYVALRNRSAGTLKVSGIVLGVAYFGFLFVSSSGQWLLPNSIQERLVGELSSTSRAPIKEDVYPVCNNSRAFLEKLRRFGTPGGYVSLNFDIQAVDKSLLENDTGVSCLTDLMLMIQNKGNQRAWFYLPYRSAEYTNAGSLLWMGSGLLQLTGSQAGQRLEEETVVRVEPVIGEDADREIWDSGRHLVLLKPGDKVFLVPLVTVPGEYRFMSLKRISDQLRPVMWKAAMNSWLESPILGAGTGGWPQLASRAASDGETPWRVAGFDHPHSDPMTVLAEKGLLGFVAYIFMIGSTIFFYVKIFRDSDGQSSYAIAGILMNTGLLVGGLTETLFNHSMLISWFGVSNLIMMKLSLGEVRSMSVNAENNETL